MAALGGKKGSYVENEGVYTTPLPRNDLQVTIKDEPVPIAFGFGRLGVSNAPSMARELC
jgi:hypothetical protein